MTSPFDWRKYTDEERAKRGETRNENDTSRKRSISSSRSVERIRLQNPAFGTLSINNKTLDLLAQKPRDFAIHKAAEPKTKSPENESHL